MFNLIKLNWSRKDLARVSIEGVLEMYLTNDSIFVNFLIVELLFRCCSEVVEVISGCFLDA